MGAEILKVQRFLKGVQGHWRMCVCMGGGALKNGRSPVHPSPFMIPIKEMCPRMMEFQENHTMRRSRGFYDLPGCKQSGCGVGGLELGNPFHLIWFNTFQKSYTILAIDSSSLIFQKWIIWYDIVFCLENFQIKLNIQSCLFFMNLEHPMFWGEQWFTSIKRHSSANCQEILDSQKELIFQPLYQ